MGFSGNNPSTRINNDVPFLQYIPFMSGEMIYFDAMEEGEIPSSVTVPG